MDNLNLDRFRIQDIPNFIKRVATPDRTYLIGVDGGAGAGKSTFSRCLAECITEHPVSILRNDDFYRPLAERWKGSINDKPVGDDYDWKKLRDEVIHPLRSGRNARFQRYDWTTSQLENWVEVRSGGITIIEGVLTTRNELSHLFDLRIWISCPRNIRIPRMLKRGDTPMEEIDFWLPTETQYIADHSPEKKAHIVIDSETNVKSTIEKAWIVKIWSPPIKA
ncbi:MAG: AAA family ATPase [Anaerolineales bacterium]